MERKFLDRNQQREDVAFEDAITPELRQKIQEAHLAAMGETPMIVPSVFEVLNLTDAQRQQMDRIKKELEPEFEKHLGIYANNASMILARIEAAIPKKNPQDDLATFMRKVENEPEYRKLLAESYASSKALAALFRSKMHEVLNNDQRKRIQELIDNPPPHAQYLIQRLRREHWRQDAENKSERAESGKDVWVPGPGSWRPGDPLPESFRQERNTRGGVPRKEN
jgi:Ni/Co efflux regulator RcnB